MISVVNSKQLPTSLGKVVQGRLKVSIRQV